MKNAFTMIELVFVIVIVGILSFVISSSFERNTLREAADQLVSHIRYTQHLAMVDDRFFDKKLLNSQNWYKTRWQLIFSRSTTHTNGLPSYTIFSDIAQTNAGEPNISEMAKNPLNPSKVLSGGYHGTLYTSDNRATETMNLGITYGVTSYLLSGGCSGARLSFDYLGRPIRGDQNTMTGAYKASTQRLIVSNCNITLSRENNQSITITIEPETGYTYISSQTF